MDQLFKLVNILFYFSILGLKTKDAMSKVEFVITDNNEIELSDSCFEEFKKMEIDIKNFGKTEFSKLLGQLFSNKPSGSYSLNISPPTKNKK